MKKSLAKAVLMSLVLSSSLVGVVNAETVYYNIGDTFANNEVDFDGPKALIKDVSTIVEEDGGINGDTTISKFNVYNDHSNEQLEIVLAKRADRDSLYSSATLVNSADTLIKGSALSILGHDYQGNEIDAINNTGKLELQNELKFASKIYNATGSTLISKEYLHGITLWEDRNYGNVISFGSIHNEGEMQIEGRLRLVADNTGNDSLDDVIINNSGKLSIENKSEEESSVRGNIVNSGNLSITLHTNDFYSINVVNVDGNFDINNNSDTALLIGKIDNSGELTVISSTESSLSIGDIVHNNGAKTYIKLGDPRSEDYRWSEIDGTITGSNYGDFKLVLEKGSEWYTFDRTFDDELYQGNLQIEPVSGVELNGGTIAFNFNHYIPVDTYNWYDKYGTLTLNNFNSNGNFGTVAFGGCCGSEFISGGICLFTDLKNNVGDKVIFTGTTPDATVPLGIYNKDDNGGIPIVREDGHSVTIIEAPSDTKMQFKTNLLTYGTPSQEFLDGNGYDEETWEGDPIDPGNYKVYKAQIDEVIDGNTKCWNFVGWEETEDNRSGKQESQKEAVEHSILVEDVEPIFKRFNDLRTDPSEIGVWVRGETGETKIRNLSYDHNIMSGGYDWDYKNDAGVLFAGVGFTYSTNECDDKAIGDTKGYGFNAYGSWLGKKNNDYVDLVVKYGKLDKSYAGYDENNIFVAGDYDKDLFTIAAKYGRRIFKDDWYYEPSVGLTWGRVGSADFTDNHGTRIHADNSYSNIASLGIQVGKNIKGIEYYGKAEVMHDFDGKIHVSAPGRSVEDDMGGTWVKCAIGASRKIDENNSFYLEVERDFGNKVEKPYGFSAGYRFTW